MNVLCVGGSVDGRRVVLEDNQKHYRVAVREPFLTEMAPRADDPVPHRIENYNLFHIHPVTRAVVFAHEDLTPTQVMEALMDGYQQEHTASASVRETSETRLELDPAMTDAMKSATMARVALSDHHGEIYSIELRGASLTKMREHFDRFALQEAQHGR